MDTLTFSAPTLFRHLTFSEAKKAPITEVTLSKALEGLGMKMPQVRALSAHPIVHLLPAVPSPWTNAVVFACFLLFFSSFLLTLVDGHK